MQSVAFSKIFHFILFVVQSLSHVLLFVTLWTAAGQAPLFSTLSQRM